MASLQAQHGPPDAHGRRAQPVGFLRSVAAASLVLGTLTGCQPEPASPGRSVSQAWQSPDAGVATSDAAPTQPAGPATADVPPVQPSGTPAAVVNGARIDAARLNAILYEGRGAEVLEQLAVLEAARQRAGSLGVAISQADIDAERRLSLQRLTDPMGEVSGASEDAARQEALLDTVLAQRQIARREFDLYVERNAWLRAIALRDVTVSQADLEAEYRARYGDRITLRHIQLATPAQIERAQADLQEGTPFEEVARRYSANTASAAEGGRLDPFTADDPRVPEGFRRAAFALRPGEVSAPVRVGRWLHIMRVDSREPANAISLDSVRPELEAAVRQRRADAAMLELFNELLKSVDVDVIDPTLKRAWDERRRNAGGPAAGGAPWSNRP